MATRFLTCLWGGHLTYSSPVLDISLQEPLLVITLSICAGIELFIFKANFHLLKSWRGRSETPYGPKTQSEGAGREELGRERLQIHLRLPWGWGLIGSRERHSPQQRRERGTLAKYTGPSSSPGGSLRASALIKSPLRDIYLSSLQR